MQKTVTVKLTHGDDIRRLAIEPTATFDKLLQDINEIVPGVCRYTLKYKDDEGDLITLKTNRELQEAFSLATGGVLRLYLVSAEPKKKEENQPYRKLKELVLKLVLPTIQETQRTIIEVEGAANVRIEEAIAEPQPTDTLDEVNEQAVETEAGEQVDAGLPQVYHEAYCNNCGNDIYNIRYKCGNCDDFDLCEECELAWSSDLSMHDASHVFLKIYRPITPTHTTVLFDNLYDSVEEEAQDNGDADVAESDDDEAESSSDSEEDDSSSSESEEEASAQKEDESSEESESESDSDSDSETESEVESDRKAEEESESESDTESESDSDSESESDSDSDSESDEEEPNLPVVDEASAALLPEVSQIASEDGEEQITPAEETCNVVATEELVEAADQVVPEAEAEPVAESSPSQTEESGVGSFLRAFQRFLGAEPTEPSHALLDRLEEMGFKDREQNMLLLKQTRNNPQAVIDHLLA